MMNHRPISVDISEVVDYMAVLQDSGIDASDETLYPCVSLPWDTAVLTCNNSEIQPLLRHHQWILVRENDHTFTMTLVRSGNAGHLVRVHLNSTGGFDHCDHFPIVPIHDDLDICARYTTVIMAFMALAFLHTRQGATLEPTSGPSRQVRRANRRKGMPEYTYKVLSVPSIRKVVGKYREATRHGVRLHIVRGHWADHRQHGICNNPNARGIYWVPPHVRGDRELGTVEKDYALAV